MRVVLPYLVLLPACLAAPPDPTPEKGVAGDAGGADASAACAPGSTLDLVYVDEIAIRFDLAGGVSLDGMAVFVNPGEDTVVVSDLTAHAQGGDPRITTNIEIDQDPAIFWLSPGEAKGAAEVTAAAVMRAAFDETWADTERPVVSLGLALIDEDAFEEAGSIDLPFEVRASDYLFPIVVTLVDEGSNDLGTPLSAARVTAGCE